MNLKQIKEIKEKVHWPKKFTRPVEYEIQKKKLKLAEDIILVLEQINSKLDTANQTLNAIRLDFRDYYKDRLAAA